MSLTMESEEHLTVSQLTQQIKSTLQTRFSSAWVAGELSNVVSKFGGVNVATTAREAIAAAAGQNPMQTMADLMARHLKVAEDGNGIMENHGELLKKMRLGVVAGNG